MAIRSSAAYSMIHVVPYTRISKLKAKSYIKAVPPQKIVKFFMGVKKDYPYKLTMVVNQPVQIRDNALEACRQYVHKMLEENLPNQYYFRVLPFPHHIQRENKMLTGAGADRMSTGMQLSFGKTICKAAILKKGAGIFEVYVSTPKAVQMARSYLDEVRSKMPGNKSILFEEKRLKEKQNAANKAKKAAPVSA